MKIINLNGQWKMKCTEERDWMTAQVPGTVFGALFHAGRAPDPFYRNNEDKITPLFREDYEYQRTFMVDSDILQHDRVYLTCEGLDTLTKISINGAPVADTNNMHRTYRFDVKGLLRKGENDIHILFSSPVKYVESKAPESKGIPFYAGKGGDSLRKAQCMFGWDWGMNIPDSGIWRDIYIECFDDARINDVQVLQHHHTDHVELDIKTNLDTWFTRFFVSLAYDAYLYNAIMLMTRYHYSQAAATSTTTLLTVVGLAFLALSSVLAGIFSDKVRKQKPFVIASSIILIASLVFYATAPSVLFLMIASALGGAGFGSFIAVDMALVARILPNKKDAAKDFGIMNIANTIPQSIVPFIAPTLLAIGSWPLFFGTLAIGGALGGVCVLPIPEMTAQSGQLDNKETVAKEA